ncbi:MAG: alpha/beta fold hydrolase [Neisseriaceae bacterium]|nr:alpha/beta fold hydrolase [Neisseriaceae bacterium]
MATMEKLNIQGLAGSLSCLLLQPETPPVGVAILLHPNPMHGGTNMNKVIQTAAKSLCSLGFLCILPNLRGVGESAGEHDYGRGETDDMLSVYAFLQKNYPHLINNLVLGGFSFGGFVACRAAQKITHQHLLLIGAAVSKYDEPAPFVPEINKTLVIHGANDEVIALEKILAWCEPQNLPVIVLPNATHFFHGKLLQLAHAIERFF